jgi:hypothetical protein
MYIKKEDFGYFEGLYKSLDEARRKKFLVILLKAGSKKIGEDISKIQVVDDSIYDERGIELGEFITRTMVKKAYKAVKEGEK